MSASEMSNVARRNMHGTWLLESILLGHNRTVARLVLPPGGRRAVLLFRTDYNVYMVENSSRFH